MLNLNADGEQEQSELSEDFNIEEENQQINISLFDSQYNQDEIDQDLNETLVGTRLPHSLDEEDHAI